MGTKSDQEDELELEWERMHEDDGNVNHNIPAHLYVIIIPECVHGITDWLLDLCIPVEIIIVSGLVVYDLLPSVMGID